MITQTKLRPDSLVKGHLELILLSVLAFGENYGYALNKEIKKKTHGLITLSEGTIYTGLLRLERARYVNKGFITVNGRRRSIYTLTREGEDRLSTLKTEWFNFSSSMGLILSQN